jgi:hypothetical protein
VKKLSTLILLCFSAVSSFASHIGFVGSTINIINCTGLDMVVYMSDRQHMYSTSDLKPTLIRAGSELPSAYTEITNQNSGSYYHLYAYAYVAPYITAEDKICMNKNGSFPTDPGTAKGVAGDAADRLSGGLAVCRYGTKSQDGDTENIYIISSPKLKNYHSIHNLFTMCPVMGTKRYMENCSNVTKNTHC